MVSFDLSSRLGGRAAAAAACADTPPQGVGRCCGDPLCTLWAATWPSSGPLWRTFCTNAAFPCCARGAAGAHGSRSSLVSRLSPLPTLFPSVTDLVGSLLHRPATSAWIHGKRLASCWRRYLAGQTGQHTLSGTGIPVQVGLRCCWLAAAPGAPGQPPAHASWAGHSRNAVWFCEDEIVAATPLGRAAVHSGLGVAQWDRSPHARNPTR